MVRSSFCQARALCYPVLLAISVLVPCVLCAEQQAQRIPRQQPRNGAVLGTVHDQYGNAVFDANVCVTEHANRPYCTNSNGEGIFRLVDLPAGEYQLVVEAEGVKTTSPQS